MATIYRFEITQKVQQVGGGGRKGNTTPSTKTTAKLGKNALDVGGSRGGVEHNRRLRAINPLLNKATHGYWEKGMRVGRAGIGFTKTLATEGIGSAMVGVGATIILSFLLQMLMKIQNQQREHAKSMNSQNFKAMENGVGAVNNQFDISVNLWDNRATYNQNK